ncbi:MAG TPA: SRPBCC domain-containing protein [Saprospiraceae bacterium]|nr:SRPBCC domain-containing protein [Saprospiraceae bacterium]HPG09570.1 SRPBCC domain-containing protein [Saprospiraceae bacterium]HRV86770.1 SRPBCC domain-containing protein [Saprospiraceae bacterium]
MENTNNRQLEITRLLHAPIELIWEAWTNPEHLVHWWGPNGFSNTIQTLDFREGGEWKMTMHGPDGTNYPNRSIFKEIILHQKIVFEHFNPHFITTVLFESRGKDTFMSWNNLFDTAEMFEIVVKAHRADEGMKQNVEKLEQFLEQLK